MTLIVSEEIPNGTTKKTLMLTIALASTAIILIIATSEALSTLMSFQTVQTGGPLTQLQTSVNVGVHADSPCTQNATFVDWGTLKPSDNTTKTIWVKNLGNTEITLSMTTTNWTPTNANSSINLSWDCQNRTLIPNEVIQATFILTISPTADVIITNFSFNIQVTGTA